MKPVRPGRYRVRVIAQLSWVIAQRWELLHKTKKHNVIMTRGFIVVGFPWLFDCFLVILDLYANCDGDFVLVVQAALRPTA